MIKKVINLLVLAIVVGIGYAPEGETGIAAKIHGEQAAIVDARVKAGGAIKVLEKKYAVDKFGRTVFIVTAEKLRRD